MPDPRRLPGAAALALVWLSRLPVGRWLPDPPPSLAASVWAFPLAGIVIGALGAGAYALAVVCGLPPAVAAILAVGAQMLATGGLHEDGLADFADGMGGTSIQQRLQIMRDSRIGSYGALTLGLVTALRIAALAALPPGGAIAALIVGGALSRAGLVVALRLMPPARPDGLGRQGGRPARPQVAAALAIGLMSGIIAVLSGYYGGFITLFLAIVALAAVQFWLGRLARRRLGGQTGDVLGALQQAGETAMLTILAARLS
ncbi:adenosylcobinamide-GDP ribazoletransferase [uncultured Paracoccus sp.]|uniref:adenosylcobinamide-GDP ribazoletransferase n=1 Tax=uncultured Paracoccus sp. TaxID=189685 RepID=UPI0025EB07FC|nr:adenosylcobinamide-GDP ribazoletransferase [uncultured Paracoccus sp.]